MIGFRAFGVYFSMPILTLLAPVLALRLGMKASMAGIGISLGLHELGHIAAARALGVEIREIRLMPFGGSARMENPYLLPAGRLAMVAAAGPVASLMAMLAAAALAEWGLIGAGQAGMIWRPSLMMLAFNLLPALPLDGGRMLYCAVQGRLGEGRALRLGIWLGRILAGLLLLGCLYLRLRAGRWNLSFLLAAVFLLSSGGDERSAMEKSRLTRLEEALAGGRSPLPLRLYQVDAETPVQEAARLMRAREGAWFIVAKDGERLRLIDGRRVLREAVEGDSGVEIGALKDAAEGRSQLEYKQKA